MRCDMDLRFVVDLAAAFGVMAGSTSQLVRSPNATPSPGWDAIPHRGFPARLSEFDDSERGPGLVFDAPISCFVALRAELRCRGRISSQLPSD
jgi:hypothetical protein